MAGPAYPGYVFKQPPPMKGKGNDVKNWQTQMNKRGFHLKVDGIYGPKSADDCRDLQKMAKLKVDGIVGPKTWDATWNAAITLPV
ncbi:peptidoglycan-binding protein [Actinomadura sp. KC06]|uniref:peptidoglycan-binding domain-containing protein n=1 Tax=Actinomadura sp. KC06 TaxID=2530369 RepID=UPI0010487CB6|nr:peptidoglycan-binding domain-containing protein [Actinomadura sp. KC06]TDD35385.1 peptidoglycan-binding protein [Actinomadura sp. KC06]